MLARAQANRKPFIADGAEISTMPLKSNLEMFANNH